MKTGFEMNLPNTETQLSLPHQIMKLLENSKSGLIQSNEFEDAVKNVLDPDGWSD